MNEVNDLDAELASLRADLPQAPAQAVSEDEPKRELTAVDVALARLAEFDNGPEDQDIADWIGRYGSEGVFMVSLAPEDTFVLRYVSSGEYRKIMQFGQEARQRLSADDHAGLEAIDDRLKFLLVKNCTLWHPRSPAILSESDFDGGRAGLLNNLVSVININSYFFPDPQQVLNFTTVLR